jgi:malate dehydrogenase (quinone)
MIKYLESNSNVDLKLGFHVCDIRRKNEEWQINLQALNRDAMDQVLVCDFLFIGAGGGSLALLEKSDIAQAKGYGGFPVSGLWLKCTDENVINDHFAKVYGKAEVGAPPMSVPHLDTRIINGERSLLFGPYAGFSTKFLKGGSYMDLFLSIEAHNVWPMITAGMDNIPLTKYLIKQVMQSHEDKMQLLRKFYPKAESIQWKEVIAGQRVQVIKKEGDHGVLKFGTEVVCDNFGTIATLLGASPGASTSVSIMLNIMQKCFPEQYHSKKWQDTLKEMIPTIGQSLIQNRALLNRVRKESARALGL